MNHKLLLRILNVAKFFNDNKIIALKNVNLDIYSGEILSLLGINGAGKTTLSSIIATLHPATSGDILKDNVSIYKDLISHRQMIGFCPQKSNIDAMLTVKENLMFAGRYFGIQKEKLANRVNFLLNQFGLLKYADQHAYVLSGGYKQRFMLARSLVHEPKLVILDEPTVGLDPNIRREIWEIIKELKSHGTTILLTTHYLDEAEKLSDRVCILDNGVIKLIDTPENLKNNHNLNNLEDVFVKLIEESKKEIGAN